MADPAVSQVVAQVSHGDIAIGLAGLALSIGGSLAYVSRLVGRIEGAIRQVVAVNSAEHAGIISQVAAVGSRITRVESRVDEHVNDHARWTK